MSATKLRDQKLAASGTGTQFGGADAAKHTVSGNELAGAGAITPTECTAIATGPGNTATGTQ